MGDIAWNGIYLKAPADHVQQALIRLTTARHFKLVKHSERAGRSDIEALRLYLGPKGNYEVMGWYSATRDWTRLVGFELGLYSYPRLLFASELILLLGCDAFECGFHSRPHRWWYKYFRNGLLMDQFEAKVEASFKPILFPFWDPNDLGTIYTKCVIGQEYRTWPWEAEIPLPPVLTQYYRGNGAGLMQLARPGQEREVLAVMQEGDPVRAINRISQSLQLPDIGKLSLEELVELDFDWPDIDLYLKLLESGFAIAIFEHPKVSLLAG